MKTCRRCRQEKPIAAFGKDRSRSDGLNYVCRPCGSERTCLWQKANKEKVRERVTKWVKASPDKMAAARARRYQRDQKVKESNAKWEKANPGKVNAKTARRRAAKLQATPPWADLEAIRQFYIDCPEGYHVDHIHPLQGKTICGLHVLNNLQYLTKSENSRKGNRYDEDEMD